MKVSGRRVDTEQGSQRENSVRVVVVVQRQTELLQMVSALCPSCRFARLLDGGE